MAWRKDVFIRNQGTRKDAVPASLHTAINAPFAPESTADDCVVRITIGERWEMSDRMRRPASSKL